MKLITRDTDYAIRALCYLAKNKMRVVSASEMVRQLKIPRPFLRKILQALNKKKILKSCKGLGGGFILNVPIEDIVIIDLIKIFQGSLKINECFFKRSLCPNTKNCVLKKKIDNIEKYVISQLSDINLTSLLR